MIIVKAPNNQLNNELNNELKVHIIPTLTNEMPFKCEWPGCESAHVNKTQLINHKRVHLGQKVNVCIYPECGERFLG